AGGEIVAVDAEDDLGPRQVEQVRVASVVARMVLEPVAPVGLLAPHLALDEHAPGAVEYRDALAEDGFESCARVLQFGSLPLPTAPLAVPLKGGASFARASVLRRTEPCGKPGAL